MYEYRAIYTYMGKFTDFCFHPPLSLNYSINTE
nr:MAG TPA: hypothetical protein [Caudoviricetes sp.]